MKLTVLDPNSTNFWMEAHKAGCADLKKRDRFGMPKGRGAWTMEADTLTEAAEVIAGDFLEEGSMSVEEALGHIHFAPCVDLPVGEVAS